MKHSSKINSIPTNIYIVSLLAFSFFGYAQITVSILTPQSKRSGGLSLDEAGIYFTHFLKTLNNYSMGD